MESNWIQSLSLTILGFVSNTSIIRLADTFALGYIINTIQKISTDIITWNKYSTKATTFPKVTAFEFNKVQLK